MMRRSVWEGALLAFLLPEACTTWQLFIPQGCSFILSSMADGSLQRWSSSVLTCLFSFSLFPETTPSCIHWFSFYHLCTLSYLNKRNCGFPHRVTTYLESQCSSSLSFAVSGPTLSIFCVLSCSALGIPSSHSAVQACRCLLNSSNMEFAYVLPTILLLLGVFPEEKEKLLSLF